MADPRVPPADDLADIVGDHQVAVAESCTGGLVAQALAKAPGSSEWFRGGVVAYQREVKVGVLGVTPGPVVTERAATEMARGVAERFGADVAVSVTGAAGPDPLDGAPPGTVVIGVFTGGELRAERHSYDGGPEQVCDQAAADAIDVLRAALGDGETSDRIPATEATHGTS